MNISETGIESTEKISLKNGGKKIPKQIIKWIQKKRKRQNNRKYKVMFTRVEFTL